MDSELKKISDLEKQKLELESALEKERLKAEVLNRLIEKANEQPGINIQKIVLPAGDLPRALNPLGFIGKSSLN